MRVRRTILFTSYIVGLLTLGQNCDSGFQATQYTTMSSSSDSPAALMNPSVEVNSTPSKSLINTKNLTFNVSVKLDSRASLSSLRCQLDSQPEYTCQSGSNSLNDLTEGPHTLRVVAQDNKGQTSAQKTLTFTVDSQVPTLTMQQSPPATTGTGPILVSFTAADATSGVDKIECALDAAAFSACLSPLTLNNLPAGARRLQIRAVDRAGNVGTVTTLNWQVDTSVPTVSITSAPMGQTKDRSANIVFSGSSPSGALASFECALDGGAFAACVSPKAYSALTDGNHTFQLRGRTASGTLSSVASVTWLIDNVAPTTPIVSANINNLTNVKIATLTFTASDVGSMIKNYVCSQDNAAFAVCTSPVTTASLADGAHTVRVKAFDNAGNESAIGTFSWNLDTVVPVLAYQTVPASGGTETTANFSFTATDPNLDKIECSTDGQAFTTCASPRNLTGLTTGNHTFTLKATDRAGNQSTLNHTWSIMGASLSGAQLYANNCAGCHGALATSTKLGRNATQISQAIAAIPNMQAIKLSAMEISAIAEALNPSTTPEVPTTADQDSTPPVSKVAAMCPIGTVRGLNKRGVRRLTRLELMNTMQDLGIDPRMGDILESYPEVAELDEVSKFDQLYSDQQAFIWNRYVDLIGEWMMNNTYNIRGSTGVSCIQSASINEDCWKEFLRVYGRKVFRRPLDTTEINEIAASLRSLTSQDAIYRVVHLLFRSPDFLFHFESGVSADGTRVRLTDHEVANRISYAMIGSMPDAALAAAADAGQLKSLAQVEAQAKRLILTTRAKTKMMKMFGEWLQLSEIASPHYLLHDWLYRLHGPENAPNEYREELYDFVQHIIWKSNGTYNDLMTKPVAFPRARQVPWPGERDDTKWGPPEKDPDYGKTWSPMAFIYGGQKYANMNPYGTMDPQPFSAPNHPGLAFRAGLLANAQMSTNPIHRGVFFKRRIFCDILPSPDFSIVAQRVAEAGILDPVLIPNHQITSRKTADSACMTCHSTINPIGFSLEMFDPLGKARTQERVIRDFKYYEDVDKPKFHPLPGAQTIALGSKTVTIATPAQMASEIASSDNAQQCMATFVMRHYERRYENSADGCALAEVMTMIKQNKPVVDVMVKMLANEDIFWRKQ